MEKHDELKKTVFEALETQNGTLARTLSQNSQIMSSLLESQSRKIHETFDVQTKSVNAAIEQHNNKIDEVIEDQRNYLQQNLRILREENEDRYHRIERSFAEINTSLSHKSDLLTETSSRLLNSENVAVKGKRTY
jgi:predicted lipoprotein